MWKVVWTFFITFGKFGPPYHICSRLTLNFLNQYNDGFVLVFVPNHMKVKTLCPPDPIKSFSAIWRFLKVCVLQAC